MSLFIFLLLLETLDTPLGYICYLCTAHAVYPSAQRASLAAGEELLVITCYIRIAPTRRRTEVKTSRGQYSISVLLRFFIPVIIVQRSNSQLSPIGTYFALQSNAHYVHGSLRYT